MVRLISTISGRVYPFDSLREYADNGESLEVQLENIQQAKVRPGKHIWQRFSDFLPFTDTSDTCSLGEGNTPMVQADSGLSAFTGLRHLLLKNETVNPTWSFKDRGSLACIFMARQMGEGVSATISTGNMGHSLAAFGARSGIRVIVVVPGNTPAEKLQAMTMHGASILCVQAEDYTEMKRQILDLAPELKVRIVTGNGPIRVEGYKLTAFEMLEQMEGEVPDFIAVPTSACGHIRGLFKGYLEMKQAGLISTVPRMIIVQARNNSPIVSAIKQGNKEVIPFTRVKTLATALGSGNPPGGNEIIEKASSYHWLAESVTEEEILAGQKRLAESGYFVEPASATSIFALKHLRERGELPADARVVVMLTGSGLKDLAVLRHHNPLIIRCDLAAVRSTLTELLQD